MMDKPSKGLILRRVHCLLLGRTGVAFLVQYWRECIDDIKDPVMQGREQEFAVTLRQHQYT